VQPDALVGAATLALVKVAGFPWEWATPAMRVGWPLVIEGADAVERGERVWILVDDAGDIVTGPLAEIAGRPEAEGRAALTLLNLVPIVRGVRERAEAAGIELNPSWSQEWTEEGAAVMEPLVRRARERAAASRAMRERETAGARA
jgi:hypothetical protein